MEMIKICMVIYSIMIRQEKLLQKIKYFNILYINCKYFNKTVYK